VTDKPARTADLGGCLTRLAWTEDAVRAINDLSCRLAVIESPGPDRAELLAEATLLTSNIVHQLRSTLDNFVRELVILNGVAAPTRDNAFPIRRVDNSPSRKKLKTCLAGVSPKHVDVITDCQPWKWDDPAAHPLERLEELWNTDKHNLLQLVDSLPAPLEVGGRAGRTPHAPRCGLHRRNRARVRACASRR
jgi:hypothetical protein